MTPKLSLADRARIELERRRRARAASIGPPSHVDVESMLARRYHGRSPAFLRVMAMGTPCVYMTDAKLPADRRATAAELRAWQEAREASAILIDGSFATLGGDA